MYLENGRCRKDEICISTSVCIWIGTVGGSRQGQSGLTRPEKSPSQRESPSESYQGGQICSNPPIKETKLSLREPVA